MKKHLLPLILAFMLTACNESYLDGEVLYKAKDYKAAYEVWLPLAEGSEVRAQLALAKLYITGRGVEKIDYDKAFEWYGKAALLNNAEAMHSLGNAYFYNRGVKRNIAKAAEWYKKASEKGDIEAMNTLKDMYVADSDAVNVNLDDLKTWHMNALENGAKNGDADSMFNLGEAYKSGTIMELSLVTKDKSKADQWYEKAYETYKKNAEKGDAYAMLQLGNIYKNGAGGIAKDKTQADQWYKKAIAAYETLAEAGDIEVMEKLKEIYQYGSIIPKDEILAQKWNDKIIEYYLKDAAQNDPQAMIKLGDIYAYGKKRDENKARMWYEKASGLGDADATYSLASFYELNGDVVNALKWHKIAGTLGNNESNYFVGSIYLEGQYVPPDQVEAVKWLSIAAEDGEETAKILLEQVGEENESGNLEAQLALGNMYKNGYGVEVDNAKAFYWYYKAAQYYNPIAEYNIALMYENGIGTAQNTTKAAFLYRQAALKNHIEAAYNLGNMYYYGKGVPGNKNQAFLWWVKAASRGHVNAQKALASFVKNP